MNSALVRGRYVIANPESVIANGAVYFEDGRILAVGPYEDLRSRYEPDVELGSNAYLVMPGLVNAHQHGRGLSSLQTGVLDDFLEPWIHRLWSQKQVDPYWDTLYTCIRLIESGVTTTLHSNYSRNPNVWEQEIEASLQAYEEAGIRVSFGIDITDQNTVVYEQDQRFLSSLPNNLRARMQALLSPKRSLTLEEYCAFFDRLWSRYQRARQRKVRILLGPVAPQWVSDDALREIRRKAVEYDAGIHIHMLETMYQKGYALQTYGKTFGEHLKDLELLGPNLSCAHCVWVTEKDIDIFASSGTSIVHNPSANLRLRSGIAPLSQMIAKGVNVGIGTDNGSLNDDDDILQDMRLALRIHRVPGMQEWCPSSVDILRMATANGARICGFEAETGTLEPGKSADMVLIRLPDVLGPYFEPDTGVSIIDALLYRAKSTHVSTVIVDGEVLMKNGKLTRINKDAVLGRLIESVSAPRSPEQQGLAQLMADIKPFAEKSWEGFSTQAHTPYQAYNSKR